MDALSHLTDDEIYGALDVVCPRCGMPEGYYCMPVLFTFVTHLFLHASRIPK